MNNFLCEFNFPYKKKTEMPVIIVTVMYIGLVRALGRSMPNSTSRIIPPAVPVTVATIIIPTISYLCSIALNEPVTANTHVPKISKKYISESNIE
jgi:hypothetical protein